MKKILQVSLAILLSGICAVVIYFLKLPLKPDVGREPFSIPQRIISLGVPITEGLYLLGVEDRLIANTIYCKKPPQAQYKEKIGTVIRADLEKIVSLKPDLVLATSLSDPEQIKRLRSLGIKVIKFGYAKSFSQICDQFLELGEIVGKKREAEEIVRRAKAKVDSIRKKVEGLPKPKVFVQIGARPLYTVNRDSFINDFIEFAGGINIAANAKSGLYNREEVLIQDPEVIIITTMGIVGEEEQEIWRRYKTLSAVKNNRIHIIDADKLCSPTPLSFAEVLEELSEILHP